MKNFFKLFGIIALAAVIGVSLAACDTGGGSGGGNGGNGGGGGGSASVTYVSEDANNIYQLTVTSKSTSSKSIAYMPETALNVSYATGVASYTPKAGDTFVLVIIVKTSGNVTRETGTVKTAGTTIELTVTNSSTSTTTITVTTSSDTMTKIKIGTAAETTLTAVQPSDAGKRGTSGDFEYTINKDGLTAEIIKYTGSAATVAIPALINNKPVISIWGYAFKDYTSLTGVTIPATVTFIGGGAFENTSLTSVTIPNSVTCIDDYAFFNCYSLTSVSIPNSVTRIGNHAFCNCSNLTSVNIPSNVTTIEWETFAGCTSLKSITIPSSVTFIQYGTFSYSSLTSVTIPSSVTRIEANAFFCYDLTSVTFQGNISADMLGTYWDGTFNQSSVTFIGDLDQKYLAGGKGTYKTTAPVDEYSVWTKQ
jgi:hypothetical protein